MKRRIAAVVILALTCGVLSGCAQSKRTDSEKLLSAIQRTEDQTRRFAYTFQGAQHALQVNGFVEDDGRYQATIGVEGRPALEEVANDDALADRFLDPNAISLLSRSTYSVSKTDQVSVGAQRTTLNTVPISSIPASATVTPEVLSALTGGRWVLDPIGAPDLATLGGNATRPVGQDPITDALTALEYTRTVVLDSNFVQFNPNSLDYDPTRDPFPRPADATGVSRYDLVQPPLPTAQQLQGSLTSRPVLPTDKTFRKMSVYVDKDGQVILVLETIDFAARVPELIKRSGIKVPKNVPLSQLVGATLGIINELLASQGRTPINVHTFSLKLSDFGANLHVLMPTNAVTGSLSVLEDRGQLATGATNQQQP